MIHPIKIKDKNIGKGYPTFLIAEMACAHQGNLQKALDLVDVAANAKADAIQIQVFKKEKYMSPKSKDYELITQLELSQEEWEEVIEKIAKKEILFFAAGYDRESVSFLLDKNVDAFKIHSADISNPELLLNVTNSQKPIFLSTGASKIEEIRKAIEFLEKNGSEKIVLMHGYQAYPTKIEDCHLNYIKSLERLYGFNVGFYDHVDGGSILAKIIPLMSSGYGAQVIEKHFILTRENQGIDYQSSLGSKDFIEFVKLLRKAEKAIGSPHIRSFTEGEINYRAHCKKSIVAKKDISKGEILNKNKVMFVRNEPGLAPDEFDKIKGKKAKRDIKQFNNIKLDDF
jgi:sialic acid synthase SpsE